MPHDPSMLLVAELCVAGLLLIVGCSHVVAAAEWSRLFQGVCGHPGAGLVLGLLTLLVGVPVLAVHWRWTGDLRSIVTVIGWGATLKGSVYIVLPGVAARAALKGASSARRFVVAGAVAMGLGALTLVGVLLGGSAGS